MTIPRGAGDIPRLHQALSAGAASSELLELEGRNCVWRLDQRIEKDSQVCDPSPFPAPSSVHSPCIQWPGLWGKHLPKAGLTTLRALQVGPS
jgi:hypothetical protein